MNKEQLTYSILSLFLVGLIVAGGTFAYYSFTATNNKNISFNTSKELQNYVIYNEGESKFSGDFKVSSTYTEGMHSTISLYKTNEASNVDLIATIKMDINEIGTNMVNSPALKWIVTSGTSTNVGSVLAQGNFIGVNNNDTITLVPNLEVTTTETFYTIWIWLDSSANPSDDLTGEILDTTVWTEINQVEGIDDSFEITRINANYQNISATVVNNKHKITAYAVTSSNNEPDEWTSIDTNSQSNVYNLNYSVSATGTYYVWFKSDDNKIVSRNTTVTIVDITPPTGSVSAELNGSTITANVTVNDSDSGAKSYYGWKVSTSNVCDSSITGFTNNTNNTFNYNLDSYDTYYVCVRIEDNAGHKNYVLSSAIVYERIYISSWGENAILDNKASTYATNQNGVQFNAISSDTNGKGLYVRAGTENDTFPVMYYRGAVTNNNVLFAGFCWKIVRTTSTGGTKLIYNGTPVDGKCTNTTGTKTQLSTTPKFNNNPFSAADVGYMYGTRYTYTSMSSTNMSTSYKYGNGVSWNGSSYTLTNTIDTTGTWATDYNTLNNNHYTCLNTTGTCTSVYYVYYTNTGGAFYITLTNGKTVEQAIDEMLTSSSNMTDSTIKAYLDSWYTANLTSYANYLEDTVWCNDRSISALNGWNPNGGDIKQLLYFGAYEREQSGSPIVTCPSVNDSFTTSSSNGNGKLTNPIGLLTADEVMMAGGRYNTSNKSYYLYTNQNYWLGSPYSFYVNYAYEFYVNSAGRLYSSSVTGTYGARPSISLKSGTVFTYGNGTMENPYRFNDDATPPTGSVSTTLNGSTITANVTVNDSDSGPKSSYGWKVSTSNSCNSSTTGFVDNTNSTYNYNLGTYGTYYVCVRIEDNAGYKNYVLSSAIVYERIYTSSWGENAFLDNKASTYVTNQNGVQFNAISSDTNGKGLYVRAGTENDTFPVMYYRGAVTNNNVLFAGFCWKIVRTTSTGGTKLVYNGTPVDGQCTNTTGTETQLAEKKDLSYNSLAYAGYMYGAKYTYSLKLSSDLATSYKYGHGVSWNGSSYTLTNTIDSTGTWATDYNTLNNNHYTCFNDTGTCTSVYYVYSTNTSKAYYITLTGGKTVENAIDEMLTSSSNTTDSTIKAYLDSWYTENLTSYANYLEDTVWCNDRSISGLNGLNPNGGDTTKFLYFGAYERAYTTYSPIVTCPSVNDSFTTSSSNGNGKLTNPIGLLTMDEVNMAGAAGSNNNSFYLYTNQSYWLLSPRFFSSFFGAPWFYLGYEGIMGNNTMTAAIGIRPSVSLKPGATLSGAGTSENPFTVSLS